MIAGIFLFMIAAAVLGGWLLDGLGYKPHSHSPEASAAIKAEVADIRNERYLRGIEAEARAIVSREKRAMELQAELDRLRTAEDR